MKKKLTAKEIEAIERAINAKGMTEALVKVQDGKVIVLQIEKRKLT